MIGIVYQKADNKIIAIIPDVTSNTDTNIVGKNASVQGIDISRASLSIVSSTTQQVGDTFSGMQLADAQTAKFSELNSKCNQTILSGFSSTALGVSHNYDFDMEAQMNFSGMMNAVNGSMAPASITWKTTDAGNLAHTQAQFKQLYADGMNFKNNQIAKYWTLKSQVLAATTVAQVNAIVWS